MTLHQSIQSIHDRLNAEAPDLWSLEMSRINMRYPDDHGDVIYKTENQIQFTHTTNGSQWQIEGSSKSYWTLKYKPENSHCAFSVWGDASSPAEALSILQIFISPSNQAQPE